MHQNLVPNPHAALATLAIILLAGPALCQVAPGDAPQSGGAPPQPTSKALIFGGGQLDFSDSGYFGGTVALPGSSIGKGLALRGSAFGGEYDYTGTPGKVHGTFVGGQVEGLYQFSKPNFWLDAAVGVRFVDTTLTPNDPSNRRDGAHAEPEVAIDGGAAGGPWRTDYYGSIGAILEDYLVRVSLTHRVSTVVRAGGEVSAEGDPTYDLQRFGPYVGYAFDAHSEIHLTAGVTHQSGEGEGGYLALSFYHGF